MVILTGGRWLAAAIAPWAIAPHPNFSRKTASSIERLALVADYRLGEMDSQVVVQGSSGEDLVNAARDSVLLGRQQSAVSRLLGCSQDQDLSVGARATAALFLSVCYAELDRPWLAIESLSSAINAMTDGEEDEPGHESTQTLIQSALRLQRSVRLVENGENERAEQDASWVRDALAEVDENNFESFTVSQGISWDSNQVQTDMADAFSRRARVILSSLAPISDNSWVDLVRSRPLWLDVRGERRAATGLAKSVSEQYDSVFRSSARSIRMGGGDPVVSPLEASLFNAELSGDFADLRARRSTLARYRMLRVADEDANDVAQCVDALRLFRQGYDRKGLLGAVRWLKVRGPDEALAEAANQVLAIWRSRGTVSRCDLAVLSAGADYMSISDRREALDCALSYQLQDTEPGLSGASTDFWTRTETAWRAVASVLPGSDKDNEIAEAANALLDLAETPYLLSPVIAEVFDSIDWKLVTGAGRSIWLDWARDRLAGEFSDDAERILRGLGEGGTGASMLPRRQGLALARQILLRSQDYPSSAIDAEEIDSASAACLAAIRRLLADAHQGSFDEGGLSRGAISVALALRFDVEDLWEGVSDLLVDPYVAASDKASTFDQLVFEDAEPPVAFLRRVELGWRTAQQSAHDEYSLGNPYSLKGASLRFGVKFGVVDEGYFISGVTEMAGGNVDAQLEAIKSLALGAPFVNSHEWSTGLILQLTHHSDVNTAVNAGYALGSMFGQYGALEDVAVGRLLKLINSGGTSISKNVLTGLRNSSSKRAAAITSILIEEVASLAQEHKALSVRVAASQLLESL